jgi:hypothetical protein
VKKIAQSEARPIFCQNYYITYTSVKSNPIIWATYVIFKNHHPKVNNCPTGEKLPNLVTLFGRHTWMIDIFFGLWVANANFSNYRRLFWLDSISRPRAKTIPLDHATKAHVHTIILQWVADFFRNQLFLLLILCSRICEYMNIHTVYPFDIKWPEMELFLRVLTLNFYPVKLLIYFTFLKYTQCIKY